jgi:5'(3')-deoxyribonucleotidase
MINTNKTSTIDYEPHLLEFFGVADLAEDELLRASMDFDHYTILRALAAVVMKQEEMVEEQAHGWLRMKPYINTMTVVLVILTISNVLVFARHYW